MGTGILFFIVFGVIESPFAKGSENTVEVAAVTSFSSGAQSTFWNGYDAQAVQSYFSSMDTDESQLDLPILSDTGLTNYLSAFLEKRAVLIERWNNDRWFFAYLENERNEAVVVAWSLEPSNQKLNVIDIARIVMDERLSEIESADEKAVWIEKRAQILGKLYSARKNSQYVEAHQILASGECSQVAGVDTEVSRHPLFLKIDSAPTRGSKDLIVASMPTESSGF